MKSKLPTVLKALLVLQILLMVLKRILVFANHWTDAVAAWFFWVAAVSNAISFVLMFLLVIKSKSNEKKSKESKTNIIVTITVCSCSFMAVSMQLIDANVIFNGEISDWVKLGCGLFSFFAFVFFMFYIRVVDYDD